MPDKPTPKPRSSFLPVMLIVVCVAVCAGATFLPVFECGVCDGRGGCHGGMNWGYQECHRCNGRTRDSLYNGWVLPKSKLPRDNHNGMF